MNAIDLERYLHEHIPLSKAMQVSVVSVDTDGVTLRAPLAPNINHQDTVFGGSASAVAILAGWSLLHTRLAAAGLNPPDPRRHSRPSTAANLAATCRRDILTLTTGRQPDSHFYRHIRNLQ